MYRGCVTLLAGLLSGGALCAGVLLTAPASEVAARPDLVCGVTGALPAAPPGRPRYALVVQIHPGLKLVTGTLTVTFRAPLDHGTDRLVFRLWPNGPRYVTVGAHLAVSRVHAGASASVTRPDPTTLVVSKPLGAGQQAVVSMTWRLVLPRQAGLRLKGGGRSLRLGSFFPLLAWDGSDWARDPPTTLPAAEAWTSPTADFDVRVMQPPGLRVLASGRRVGRGRWRARAVRDFTLAVGRFDVVTGTARVPTPVLVTVGVEKAAGASRPQAFLRSAIASLRRYSALYGPYPWRTYTMVGMADLPVIAGGLEYPTLVYQPAVSANAAHETAHQWFYSLVGNDQARDPWLDEGLATWAEAAVNGAPPFQHATIPPEAANRIGQPMSFWDRLGEQRYFLGAYLQSYRALLSLGPRPQVDCALRRYVLGQAYRVARPRDLLLALEASFPDAERTLEAFGATF
jgi:Peptidase family M1 domain